MSGKAIEKLHEEFIYKSRYARWSYDKGRREKWEETVDRYFDFMRDRVPESLLGTFEKAKNYVLDLQVMPSMRALWSAGEALKRENVAAYNCSALAIDNVKAFADLMYLSLNGAGVGISVERQFINELPKIKKPLKETDDVIVVEDSKEGWAQAIFELTIYLFEGIIPKIDVSKVRPAGSILKTFGGRASGPEPLLKSMKFMINTFKNIGEDGKLSSLDCHDISCALASAVVVGGVRRSSIISLSNLSDLRMRHAKDGNYWDQNPQRALANNSVAYTEKPTMKFFLDEWMNLMTSGTGERGIFNREAAKKKITSIGRRDPNYDWLVNPCVTGDMKVYVADGRGEVSFKELAERGEDVPVFCINSSGDLTVREMLNPRITRRSAPIYEVMFNDGMVIKGTDNHKIKMKDGKYVKISDICEGDRVDVLKKFDTNTHYGVEDKKKNSRCRYNFLQMGKFRKSEHNLIAEFKYSEELPKKGYVVHHKDYDSKNNSLDNLILMKIEEHKELHRLNMLGDKNPMVRAKDEWSQEKWDSYKLKLSKSSTGVNNKNYSGTESDLILNHALILTQFLKRRFSQKEWVSYAKKHKLPMNFSKLRLADLGLDGYNLSNWAANKLNMLDYADCDLKTIKKFEQMKSKGYDCFIQDGGIYYKKTCEFCKLSYITKKHSISYCSQSCVNKSREEFFHMNEESKIKCLENMRKYHENRKSIVRLKQLEVFYELNNKLHRTPLKKEWVEECKLKEISFEISRESSPFRSWNDLKTAADVDNHIVKSIKFLGYEDVYNGNVEDYHNYFIGGMNNDGEIFYFNTLNCGEIFLRPNQFCNLSEVVIRPNDSLNTLQEKVKYATILGILQSTLTNFNFIDSIWKKNSEEERLLGVSLSGIMDHHILNNEKKPERMEDWLSAMKETAINVAKKWSKELNINMPAAITTCKPSGTVSLRVGCSPGIHPRWSPYYIRRVRNSKNDPITKFLIDKGVPWHPENGETRDNYLTAVFEFPLKSPSKKCVLRGDKNAIEQLEHWKIVNEVWCEHEPSITIYVKDNEWLEVGAWVYKNFDMASGISFLPYDNGAYQLTPFEEIDEETYKELVKKFPKGIDFEDLVNYESDDYTEGASEIACTSGACLI